MELYLQDFGHRQQIALLQARIALMNSESSEHHPAQAGGAFPEGGRSLAQPRLGWLGRHWARAARSTPEVAAAGLHAMRGQTYGMFYGMVGGSLGFWISAVTFAAIGDQFLSLCFGAGGALLNGFGFWLPGYVLHRLCGPPVSVGELVALEASAPDELERAYLRLAADTLQQRIVPEAADRVRAALRALGGSLDQLPRVVMPSVSIEELRREALQAHGDAVQEPDAVVAASFERRANALERSAFAARRSEALMRRASALREEMMAQIESLRLGLAGFETASGDVTGLILLADAVRAVATEAVSVTNARAEIDSALSDSALSCVPPAETCPRLRARG